jgi:hypothetical protein
MFFRECYLVLQSCTGGYSEKFTDAAREHFGNDEKDSLRLINPES